MKALSLKEPWASLVASGEKIIETRTWPTQYRGPLLIVGSARPDGQYAGKMACVVDVVACWKMRPEDEKPPAVPSMTARGHGG